MGRCNLSVVGAVIVQVPGILLQFNFLFYYNSTVGWVTATTQLPGVLQHFNFRVSVVGLLHIFAQLNGSLQTVQLLKLLQQVRCLVLQEEKEAQPHRPGYRIREELIIDKGFKPRRSRYQRRDFQIENWRFSNKYRRSRDCNTLSIILQNLEIKLQTKIIWGHTLPPPLVRVRSGSSSIIDIVGGWSVQLLLSCHHYQISPFSIKVRASN
jgi:hypothetical protein